MDIIVRAHTNIAQLENLILPSSSPSLSSFSSSPMSTPTTKEPPGEAIARNGKDVVLELGKLIETEDSPERVEELLGLCDRINFLLAKVPSARPSKPQLQGLGLKINNDLILDRNGASSNGLLANGNGDITRSESPDQYGDEEPSPTTPKVDKGKGRAEPEPEQHEPVLSPSHFLVGESEDEDEEGHRFLHLEDIDEPVASPTDR